jgi:hypothetical protein
VVGVLGESLRFLVCLLRTRARDILAAFRPPLQCSRDPRMVILVWHERLLHTRRIGNRMSEKMSWWLRRTFVPTYVVVNYYLGKVVANPLTYVSRYRDSPLKV